MKELNCTVQHKSVRHRVEIILENVVFSIQQNCTLQFLLLYVFH